MEVLGSVPWLAVVLLTAAAALCVLEAALPGFGLAGGAGVACAGVAAVVVHQVGTPWWPLVAVAAAAAGWTLMVWWRRAPVPVQAAVAGVDAAGGVGYGVLGDDPVTIVVGVAGALALALAFPVLNRWAVGLVDRQPTTGMEALVGRTAVVEAAPPGGRPVVHLDGALWSIVPPAGASPPAPGTTVVVRSWQGMVLAVEPVAAPPGVPSASS